MQRGDSEFLHAVQYHMSSKAGLRVKKLGKGWGGEAWRGGRVDLSKSDLLLAQAGLYCPSLNVPHRCPLGSLCSANGFQSSGRLLSQPLTFILLLVPQLSESSQPLDTDTITVNPLLQRSAVYLNTSS